MQFEKQAVLVGECVLRKLARQRLHIAIKEPSLYNNTLHERIYVREQTAHLESARFKSILRRIAKSDICSENKNILLEFLDYLVAEGLSLLRVIKYLEFLFQIALILKKPFEDATEKDIRRVIAAIECRDYSEWTKHDYRVILKRFYKWLRGDNDYPPEVKWISTSMKRKNNVIPEELLTQKEVMKMIDAAENPRDKAIIAFLYESGCRVGELLSMRIKHLSFDEYGAKAVLKGKTGMRRIRIIFCVPYLAVWLENHPLKNDPNAPLWIGLGTKNRNKALHYQNVRVMLKKVALKAGVKKRVNPHMFRHTRATHLANHLTEAQMNHYFGWVQGSDMPSTYVHLSGRDVDNAILSLYGIKEKEKDGKEKLTPIRCPRCGTMNSPPAKLCVKCGMKWMRRKKRWREC